MAASHLEILVEEPSAEAALEVLLPRMIGDDISFKIHTFQCKHDLTARLPDRLRGYRSWLPPDWRIVVLLDRDTNDCATLKADLEDCCYCSGLPTKARPSPDGTVLAITRLAIEELEAWFFGDTEALVAAYPGVPQSLHTKAQFRDPDAIRGGTWEQLERVLQRSGHHRGGLNKVKAAREIATQMEPARNRSKSFQAFSDGLSALLA